MKTVKNQDNKSVSEMRMGETQREGEADSLTTLEPFVLSASQGNRTFSAFLRGTLIYYIKYYSLDMDIFP